MNLIILSILCTLVSSCAALYHVQLGDIESSQGAVLKPFDIKISEVGISIGEIVQTSKFVIADKGDQKRFQEIANIISLFQMGPKTGLPVYVKDYAKNLIQVIYEKCPSGHITGLTSIREARKYPIISGEIVKVTGYCVM